MDSSNLMELCRLCLDKDRVSIPIFEGEGVERKIFLKIGSCLPVKVSEDDPLPKKICDDCTYKVELVYSFWNTTANAEKQLLEWLGFRESPPEPTMEMPKTEMVLLKEESLEHEVNPELRELREDSPGTAEETGEHREESEEESDGNEDPGGGHFSAEEGVSSMNATVGTAPNCMTEAGPSGIQQQKTTTQPVQHTLQDQQPIPQQSSQPVPIQQTQTQPQLPLGNSLPDDGDPAGSGPVDSAGRRDSHQEEVFKCHKCSKQFSTLNKLSLHSKFHKERKFECKVCHKKFLTEHHLKMHGAMHEEIRPHTCDKCGCSFRYMKTLETHRRIHTNEEEDRPFLCLVCDMRFGTRNAYNHHTKNHRDVGKNNCNNSSSCRFCGKFFISRQLLVQHLRIHTGEKGFTCDQCGKELTSQESLMCHKLMHSGEKQLNCTICGRSFSHRKYYVVHQRIHTGERPYRCDVCNKSFTQSSTLTVHRRYHTGERPYRCTLCCKGFVTRTLLLSHEKKHSVSVKE